MPETGAPLPILYIVATGQNAARTYMLKKSEHFNLIIYRMFGKLKTLKKSLKNWKKGLQFPVICAIIYTTDEAHGQRQPPGQWIRARPLWQGKAGYLDNCIATGQRLWGLVGERAFARHLWKAGLCCGICLLKWRKLTSYNFRRLEKWSLIKAFSVTCITILTSWTAQAVIKPLFPKVSNLHASLA